MPLNSVFSWVIKKRVHQIELFKQYPSEVQNELLLQLIQKGAKTQFGKEHSLISVKNLADFKKAIPVRPYEGHKPYIDRMLRGERNVLAPDKVNWFAKSSGTTAGRSKFIPVTQEALEDCHYKGGKDLLGLYYHNLPTAKVYSGKHLVLGGSSNVSEIDEDIYSGDLSAIIIKNLPIWVEALRIPNQEIALLSDWEEKIERLALASMDEDVHSMSGVPSWTLVLLKRILEIKRVDTIDQVWPNLELYMHGGVSFKPYAEQFKSIIKSPQMNYMESYNASEGFFGIQDQLNSDEMLLMLDYGIYYEFMPVSEYGKEFPETLTLTEVEKDTDYAIVITTNGGLYRYLVGDTIRFSSLKPHRIRVSGRTKLFINAFGEELIIDNAESAISEACRLTGAKVNDFTAAPVYMDNKAQGAHEWVIEFEKHPDDLSRFNETLDRELCRLNTDYEAKRSNDLTLRPPLVNIAETGTFYGWMKSRGKLGGQNKVPRLANHREYMDDLLSYCHKIKA